MTKNRKDVEKGEPKQNKMIKKPEVFNFVLMHLVQIT